MLGNKKSNLHADVASRFSWFVLAVAGAFCGIISLIWISTSSLVFSAPKV
jgi:hypothetical protein